MTTIYEQRPGLSRRELLKRGTLGAALIITGNAVISPDRAWGMETAALKPETMATLIKLARDIYPHDAVSDRFYAMDRGAVTISGPVADLTDEVVQKHLQV